MRVGLEIDGQYAQEHEHRAGQGVEEELDGRVLLFRPPPDADEEVHGHQGDLPEDIEQDQVQGDEHAEHADLEDQEPEEVLLDPVDDVQRGHQGDEGHERGQQDQGVGEAVDAQEVLRPDGRDPGQALDELHAGGVAVEQEVESDAQDQGQSGRQERDDLDGPFALLGQAQHEQGPGQRQKGDEAEDVHRGLLTRSSVKIASKPRPTEAPRP